MSLIDESDMPPSEEGTRAASVAAPEGLSSGDRLRELFEIVYAELRRVAHRHLGGERVGHTLGTTGLVHEAYLELARLEHIQWPGRAYVLAAASQAMRRILIDYALARSTRKRGGGVANVPLDDAVAMAVSRSDTLLALDEALDRLSDMDPQQARIVELRFFAGMTIEETADALDISPATVKRDWTWAKAWLHQQLVSR